MLENYIVENHKLDNEQLNVLKNDCNMMIIAGAGSGKSLTIIGKINYLIEKKLAKPSEILAISFTNNSVNDLKNRIKSNVKVLTFHKLAIYILENSNIKYKICNDYLLKYIIAEKILTLNPNEQKIILKFLKYKYNFADFLKSKYYNSFFNFILSYINFYKTFNFSHNNIKKIKYSKIEKKIIIIIMKIYKEYISEKRSQQLFDFDDLIIYATKFVKNSNINIKYIIIDEFQDSSIIRLNLIKEICKYMHSKIIVVGDDWQSIYQFSGCDLSIFLDFQKYFDNVLQLKLNNTYRNSQELINIASKFIEKNKFQIKKELVSIKRCNDPIIFVPYEKKNILEQVLNFIIKYSNNILVISRNNKDIYKYLSNNLSFVNDHIIINNISIKYLTIHKSKGLEAEYVILLNCNEDYLGFPNKIENNPIITKFLKNEKIKYAEERRLFYVAITRCKYKTFLLFEKRKPSIFIKEMKKICKKELGKITYF